MTRARNIASTRCTLRIVVLALPSRNLGSQRLRTACVLRCSNNGAPYNTVRSHRSTIRALPKAEPSGNRPADLHIRVPALRTRRATRSEGCTAGLREMRALIVVYWIDLAFGALPEEHVLGQSLPGKLSGRKQQALRHGLEGVELLGASPYALFDLLRRKILRHEHAPEVVGIEIGVGNDQRKREIRLRWLPLFPTRWSPRSL